ncbi:hypothetical protein FRC01_007718 [Tulasnella sp. 417]|nr:hypothetical protein FRC01_007718 [Tulasnella sp. 417]
MLIVTGAVYASLYLVELVPLEVSDSIGEQAGSDGEEDVGGEHEEDGEGGARRSLGDDETDNHSAEETGDGRERDYAVDGRRLTPPMQRTASKPSRMNRDERQKKKGPFTAGDLPLLVSAQLARGVERIPLDPSRPRSTCRAAVGDLGTEGLVQLCAPFGFRLVDAEHGEAHDEAQDGPTYFGKRVEREDPVHRLVGGFVSEKSTLDKLTR